MTLLICFDNIKKGNLCEDDLIRVSENASSMGGSQVFLEPNVEYKTSELIKSIVVASANDASVAIAEKISGSEKAFVELMNNYAKELKMDNTCFVNCTGLPKAGQYSCAKDVATMFSQLIKHQLYFNYSSIWMDKIEHPKGRFTEISNTNKLIRFYDGCDSGKTGYTSEAGHCLAASANKNGMRLICVVINSPNSKTRFKEASTMFNYGFNNYVNKLIVDNKIPLSEQFNIKRGQKDKIEVIANKPIFIFSKRNEQKAVEIVVNKNDNLVAPIAKGDVVGEISVYENGVKINSVAVIANETVLVKNYNDSIYDIVKNWAL